MMVSGEVDLSGGGWLWVLVHSELAASSAGGSRRGRGGEGRAGEVQITLSYIIAADEEATRIK